MITRLVLWLAHLTCRNRPAETGQVWAWYDRRTGAIRRARITNVMSSGVVTVMHEAAEVAYRPQDFRAWVRRQRAAVDWDATDKQQKDEDDG